MSNLFRVSFSIIDPWSKGNFDEAVARWLRMETIVTPQMEEGKLIHESFRNETLQTGKLPKIFGDVTLKNPVVETKMTIVLDDWCEYVGIPDMFEPTTIHEYKTGNANSTTYARTMQVPCYQLLLDGNGYQADTGIIHHWNQYEKQVSESKMYLSDQTKQSAYEWIITYASELRDALEKTGNL